MCGISGAFGHLDAELRAAVRAAHRDLAHRGPDAEKSWESSAADGPGVVFAHRRLAIIDLSPDGVQPMHDEKSGAVIVFNGEIYNYRELRAELASAGHAFRTRSDTEVLLRAYAQWGPDCVSHLRGMFAFVLWDPARRKVVIARDRLGIKPLYLARVRRPGGRNAIVFASEVRALLGTGLVDRRLDPTALASFLWHGFVVGADSAVRGVQRVEPGTLIEVDLDGLDERETRYWTLPRHQPVPDAVERLRTELEDAVRLRLISDVPLGVFLSGGIDSSAITALAVRVAGEAVRTFNIRFDEARFDESGHARAVAEALGTDHTEVRLSESVFQAQLPDALESIDQPTFDAINTYFVSRAVREAGLTVALAGTGGDELFGGYGSFRDLPRMATASRLAGFAPRSLVRAAADAFARARLGPAGAVPPQTRWGKLADVLEQRGKLLELYQLAYGLFVPSFLAELAPGLTGAPVRMGLPLARADRLAALIAGQPPLHAVSLLELASFVGERLLPDTDMTSMAVALEARVPLLDHRVVEAAAGVPIERRFAPLGRKQLLRDLALGELDPALFDRPKRGFELPLEVWVRRDLRAQVDDTLRDRDACHAAGLDPAVVARLWDAFQAGAPGLYWSRIWALFVLLWWCRRHRVSL